MNLKFSMLLVAVGASVACGGGAPRPPMSDGERLYLARCTACHRTYEPGEFTPQAWAKEVAKMERLKKVTLEPAERALVLGFLGGAAAAEAPAPAASSLGGGVSSAR